MIALSPGYLLLFTMFLLTSCEVITPSASFSLSVTSEPNPVANGVTSYTVTASVSPAAEEEFRVVTFQCSDGFFSGVTSTSATASSLHVDQNGQAQLQWIAPNKAGKYTISASIGKGDRIYRKEQVITLQTTREITLSVPGSTTVLADGESLLPISVTLLNASYKQVSVVSTAGTLLYGNTSTQPVTVQLNAQGTGSVNLRVSNKVEPYLITAYATEDPNLRKEFLFSPRPAPPDDLFLSIDNTTVAPNSSVPITAVLTRTSGQVSLGTKVQFKAYQTIADRETSVGNFRDLSAGNDTQGRVTVQFLTDTLFLDMAKAVNIRATITNSQGQEKSKELTFVVKKSK